MEQEKSDHFTQCGLAERLLSCLVITDLINLLCMCVLVTANIIQAQIMQNCVNLQVLGGVIILHLLVDEGNMDY